MVAETTKRIPLPPVNDTLLREIVERIVAAFHPRRIILFGSRARAESRPDSDVDLLVEMEALADQPRWKRRLQIDRLFEKRWWPMDILVYTPGEMAERRWSLVSIVPSVEQEGKVLYERRGD